MTLDRTKRMSECTEAEKDEGALLWLSENYQWERKELHPVVERALRHVASLRSALEGAEREIKTLRGANSGERALRHAAEERAERAAGLLREALPTMRHRVNTMMTMGTMHLYPELKALEDRISALLSGAAGEQEPEEHDHGCPCEECCDRAAGHYGSDGSMAGGDS